MNRPNDGTHIRRVIDSVECKKHNALLGVPCFHIKPGRPDAFGYLAGICGRRIREHGFTGDVTPMSMSLKTPGGRHRPPRNSKK